MLRCVDGQFALTLTTTLPLALVACVVDHAPEDTLEGVLD